MAQSAKRPTVADLQHIAKFLRERGRPSTKRDVLETWQVVQVLLARVMEG